MERPVLLECRNLWKVYGHRPDQFLKEHGGNPSGDALRRAGMIGAVRDANVKIRQGEIFVIMGLSGSGKSTLVRCLSRLIRPDAGELIFDGQNILPYTDKQMLDIRRRRMGMVFQHFALLPHLTVLENAAFPLEIQGVPRAKREAQAREVIELVGLKGREDYYPSQLSGGQQQRVGIARSLAVEPDLWFLDEPFSALDPLIRREMQDEFMRLQAMLKKTIVFITHDFDEAIRLADRIAVMRDGRIVQVATPQDLVLSPADDYVAEFTRYVPKSKVLTMGAIMAPGAAAGDVAGELIVTDRVEAVADRIERADGMFNIRDEEGRIVGHVGRAVIIDILVGRSSAA
ncbi:quaternary amine ABC transporter ATP-binding protein [Arenibacterium halophilum]|uniref:Quaternary amine transport ATP-binding protein n=1 Tax=Arenibacterium halophilum TaxID=2583821 RepID=A0ABY2X9Q0_9RHOB|nr:glycine betaine/L-proline ABC transporter ATP-binding protein [Arenibacterium halophilum]TMV12619.1 betaine/proline/choline family ABC transporter ATP-binding protein [Arenibacterium halophilum]